MDFWGLMSNDDIMTFENEYCQWELLATFAGVATIGGLVMIWENLYSQKHETKEDDPSLSPSQDLCDLLNRASPNRDIRVDELLDRGGTPLIRVKTKKLSWPIDATVHTFTVVPCGKNGLVPTNRRAYGSDDETYKHYPHLQRLCPRAFSLMIIRDEVDGGEAADIIINGMAKFTGLSSVYEDTGVAAGFLTPELLEKSRSVCVTEKANGKAAVVRVFRHKGRAFIFGGSKNMHTVIPLYEDNKDNKENNDLHVAMLRLFRSTIGENSEEIVDFLDETGYTLCGEYEDGMHFVYREEPVIKWFGVVKSQGAIPEGHSLAESPRRAFELLRLKCGNLPTVEHTFLTKRELEEKRQKLRHGFTSEGSVILYLDGDGGVIAMEKFKTDWYVILRVLREIMKHYIKDGLDSSIYERLWDTLCKRNTDFLDLPVQTLYLWWKLEVDFIEWFRKEGYSPRCVGFMGNNNNGNSAVAVDEKEKEVGMAVMWKKFTDACPEKCQVLACDNDKWPETFFNGPEFDAPRLVRRDIEELLKKTSGRGYDNKISEGPLVVLLQGFPGLGKNTVGEHLAEQLRRREGLRVEAFDQDSPQTAGKACMQKFKRCVNREILQTKKRGVAEDHSDLDVVILMRCNANMEQASPYISEARKAGCRVLALTPNITDENRIHYWIVAAQSVITRRGHPAFDKIKKKTKRIQIMTVFFNILRPLTSVEGGGGGSGTDTTARINYLRDADRLSLIADGCRDFVERYCSAIGDNFNAPMARTYEEIAKGTGNFNIMTYEECMGHGGEGMGSRRSIADVSHQMLVEVKKMIGVKKTSSSSLHCRGDIKNKNKKEPDYIGLPVPEFVRGQLVAKLCEMVAEGEYADFKTYASHVTLMHKSNMGDRPDLWEKLKDMAERGEVLENVRVTGVVTGRSYGKYPMIVFNVAMGSYEDGDLVHSKTPHITGLLHKKVRPFRSVELIRQSAYPSSEFDPIVCIPIEKEFHIIFDAKVTSYHV